MQSTRRSLWRWIEQGYIKDDDVEAALGICGVLPDKQAWNRFIDSVLLWLASLALTVAVLFFVAYNWDAMGRMFKFSILQLLILLALMVYTFYKPGSTTNKVGLATSSLLLGVLLALYGQTYQTGADPWQLFALWAFLILPWVLMARLSALWLFWILLINTACILYADVYLGFFRYFDRAGEGILMALFLLNSLFMLVWEYLYKRFGWLGERWPLRLLALFCGLAIVSIMFSIVLGDGTAAFSPVFVLWVAVFIYFYQGPRIDLFMLAIICFSVSSVITALVGRAVIEMDDYVVAFFILTLVVVGLVTASALWLKKVQRDMAT